MGALKRKPSGFEIGEQVIYEHKLRERVFPYEAVISSFSNQGHIYVYAIVNGVQRYIQTWPSRIRKRD